MTRVQILQAQGQVPVMVLQLQDRINLGNYQELEQLAKDAYDKGMRGLVIDWSKTSSLTSIGIRALVVVHKILGQIKRNTSNWRAPQSRSTKCCKLPGSPGLQKSMIQWRKR